MTDKEIIKGFETCGITCGCSECPYAGVSDDCLEAMKSDILDLINRLKAENDDLKRDTIPKLQNSLERANEYGIETDKENERLKAKIGRLTVERDNEHRCYLHICEDLKQAVNRNIRAKSKAYKEFVTKAEKKAQNAQTWTGIEPVVTVSDLNNILKEMGLIHDT